MAGHLEPVHFAHQVVAAAAGLHQIAVDQAADRLDRVEGNPVGAVHDPVDQVRWQVLHQVGEEGGHRLGVERLEVDGGHSAALTPCRTEVHQLGTGQRQDQDRVLRRPVENRLEEIEEPLVGELEILDGKDHRVLFGQPLE